MYHVTRTKLTQAEMKKDFRIKLLVLCKTRTKKSSPDLSNFYVVLAGHDTVTETGTGQPRAGAYSKSHDYKQKVQKTKDLLKTWVLTGKQFQNFPRKKSQTPILAWRTKQRKHKTTKTKTEHVPCNQDEINWSKIEKSIQIKTVESRPD